MTYNIYCYGVLYATNVTKSELDKYKHYAFAIEEIK